MADVIKEIFVDGVANVNLSLGAFRFDLVTIKGMAEGQDQPELNSHVRVIMSPQGYLQLVSALQNFLGQVEDKGIIRREAVEKTEDAKAEGSSLKKKKEKE